MLSCNNLTIAIEDNIIFQDFGLSLMQGSIHLLKGKNGSGKTSLFKAIAGLIKPNSGEIITKVSIGYLGHENAIKANLTVHDNLSLWADLNNTHLLIPAALSHFELLDLIDTKCKYLSAGWLRRVALARMIVSNSKLWLLDEPEANLDAKGRELLLKLLQAKISNGGMAIIASHNLDYYHKIPQVNLEDFRHG